MILTAFRELICGGLVDGSAEADVASVWSDLRVS